MLSATRISMQWRILLHPQGYYHLSLWQKAYAEWGAQWEFPNQCPNLVWACRRRNQVHGALFCWYCIDILCDESFLPLASWQMVYAIPNPCKGPRKLQSAGLQLYLKIHEMIPSGVSYYRRVHKQLKNISGIANGIPNLLLPQGVLIFQLISGLQTPWSNVD